MRHCVIDIETLGDVPNSIVISVAAVVIDPFADKPLVATWDANIDPEDGQRHGLTFTTSTLDWWMRQKPGIYPVRGRLPLVQVLKDLRRFWQQYEAQRLWAHADFDPVLLRGCYLAAGLTPPWTRWQVRCLRTMNELLEVQGLNVPKVQPKRKHVALDDAIAEAQWLCAAWLALAGRVQSV